MTGEIVRYEHGGVALVVADAGVAVFYADAELPGDEGVEIPPHVLRWLVTTAGPAALALLDPLKLNIAPREVAGPGGGPEPAAAEATEPPDEQLALDAP